MSIRDFWTSVRTAASLRVPKVEFDAKQVDQNRWESVFINSDIWLTPEWFESFDEADFGFLADDERRRLTNAVHKFREIARNVPAAGPASNEQEKQAREQLDFVADEILCFDKYLDPDSFVIGKKLEQSLRGRLPGWVRDMRFETGFDVVGDPAIWIWVIVDDEAAETDVITANFGLIQQQLGRALRQLGVTMWPYIRLQTVSEQVPSA